MKACVPVLNKTAADLEVWMDIQPGFQGCSGLWKWMHLLASQAYGAHIDARNEGNAEDESEREYIKIKYD